MVGSALFELSRVEALLELEEVSFILAGDKYSALGTYSIS
jgi:hypothetical protein